jgi:hypothetical protein
VSTKIHDLANQALVYNASGTPAAKTASITVVGNDMITGDGLCSAIQDIGTVSGTNPTWAGKFQESDDNVTFTDIPGATFAQVTATGNIQVISFLRTKRYVGYVGTIGGTSTPTFGLDVILIEQKKTLN